MLREAAAVTPLDGILVETDAPFLTPMPYRGRPNATYLIPDCGPGRGNRRLDARDVQAISANGDRAFGPWQ